MIRITVALALATAACAPATTPVVQRPAPSESGAFVSMLGTDTVSVEEYVIAGNRLVADAVTRSPRTIVRRLGMSWDDQGRVTEYEMIEWLPGAPADSVRARQRLAVGTDSLRWTTWVGNQMRQRSTPARVGHSMFAVPLFSPYEVLLRNLVKIPRDSASVLTSGGSFDFAVTRPSEGVVVIHDAGLGTLRFTVDRIGRIQSVDGSQSTTKYAMRRLPATIDIQAWAREFAARDAAGRGLGPLSLPDSVVASAGGANVRIAYHRPSKRGRTIFGGQVVPFGRVWRTGANQATAFTTDRDLIVGGTRIPAGTYTLWTIPGPNEWQLIFNRQTGQWGTIYNAAQDLAHIQTRVEAVATPVELFTIAVEPRGDGGTLSFTWDRTRASVAFTVVR